MIRTILRYPDRTLRQKSAAVPSEAFGTAELKQLVEDLFDTMRAAHGLGLSAIQIGVPQRVSVMWLSRAPLVLINPTIVAYDKAGKIVEGCLSLPGAAAYVRRYHWIKVRAFNEQGEAFEAESVGTDAQAIQHEIDHMDGKLYIDRLKPGARQQCVIKATTQQPRQAAFQAASQ